MPGARRELRPTRNSEYHGQNRISEFEGINCKYLANICALCIYGCLKGFVAGGIELRVLRDLFEKAFADLDALGDEPLNRGFCRCGADIVSAAVAAIALIETPGQAGAAQG